MKIGSAVYSTYALDGALDDVRVYSKVLTAGEVTTVMGGGTLSAKGIPFAEGELSVYPSIVNDFLTVKTSLNEELQISVYNLLGVLINKTTSKQNSTKVDMNSLSNGLYFVNITAGSRATSLKIIKQ